MNIKANILPSITVMMLKVGVDLCLLLGFACRDSITWKHFPLPKLPFSCYFSIENIIIGLCRYLSKISNTADDEELTKC